MYNSKFKISIILKCCIVVDYAYGLLVIKIYYKSTQYDMVLFEYCNYFMLFAELKMTKIFQNNLEKYSTNHFF